MPFNIWECRYSYPTTWITIRIGATSFSLGSRLRPRPDGQSGLIAWRFGILIAHAGGGCTSRSSMSARPSEIRAFLLRFAAKRGIRVQEHISDAEGGAKTAFYCHLESAPGEWKKTSTSISYEGHDNALVMAFLSFSNPDIDFLDSDMVSDSV